MQEPTDESERKTIADVEGHGWHVVKVMGDSEGPPFAYTVGLTHTFGHAELIVVGLPLDAAHAVLNDAGEAIRRGARYAEGLETGGLFEGRAARFREMPTSQYQNYMGWTLWFYDGPAFEALQMIWPDQDGRWPGEPPADAEFLDLQPVIADRGDPPWAHRARAT